MYYSSVIYNYLNFYKCSNFYMTFLYMRGLYRFIVQLLEKLYVILYYKILYKAYKNKDAIKINYMLSK